ncbi:MAG: phosphoribosylformylglycinamidine cyclo-ligase [Candidatus Hermodarchaeota archaeon]
MSDELTYAKAGVDLDQEKIALKNLWQQIQTTFRFNPHYPPVDIKGHYAGLVDIGLPDKYLATTVDGVGTKVLIAEMMEKYDTVGIDCIAMNVNDLICLGAEPFLFVDYLAIEKMIPSLVEEIVKGLVEGARQSRVAIIGGETATMPQVIKGFKPETGFDLAGMALGIVNKENIITGEKIKSGDKIIGIASTGIHSNGFSLARKTFFDKAGLTVDSEIDGFGVGSTLLEPTAIYVPEVLELISNVEVHGLANITGGSFSKLQRLNRSGKLGFELDRLPDPPQIFKTIQRLGNVPLNEMYRTFNMGVGFCVVVPAELEEKAIKIIKQHKREATTIGSVSAEAGIVRCKLDSQEVVFH